MTEHRPLIVWLRQDLRLADNPALFEAAATGRPLVVLYILDDETPGRWQPGGAARWWLHGSLAALADRLADIGLTLTLRRGAASTELAAVIDAADAAGVYWNRCYGAHEIARDGAIKAELKDRGIEVKSFNAQLLFEPWTVETKTGGFYKVYTRFWHAVRDKGTPERPWPVPDRARAFDGPLESDDLDVWALRPTAPDWAGGLRERWTPGEAGAMARLGDFLENGLHRYDTERDFPAVPATSNLSPHLHAGDIGPRQVWYETVKTAHWSKAAEKFLKEVVWREFAYHVFYHLPDLPTAPMQEKFADFPWAEDDVALRAWQRGRTGYPLVDAGMRELWQTGHMHNRVRMVTASFLIKHLMQPWQAGEDWFWDTLVDADLAVNAFSWQWVAGSGADAAPYFRIFNPTTQAEKFDPDGDYIRRYVPEIAALPTAHLHAPWAAPDHVLAEAGVTLGETYPYPIVDHKTARERALAAFKGISGADAAV